MVAGIGLDTGIAAALVLVALTALAEIPVSSPMPATMNALNSRDRTALERYEPSRNRATA